MAVLLQVNVMAKILVCTHSNSAADIYIERLDKKLGHGMFSDQNVFLVQTFLFCFLTKVTFNSVEYLKGKVLRHYYYNRKTDSIKPTCLKYTNRVSPIHH